MLFQCPKSTQVSKSLCKALSIAAQMADPLSINEGVPSGVSSAYILAPGMTNLSRKATEERRVNRITDVISTPRFRLVHHRAQGSKRSKRLAVTKHIRVMIFRSSSRLPDFEEIVTYLGEIEGIAMTDFSCTTKPIENSQILIRFNPMV
jgi:hypothetical protein